MSLLPSSAGTRSDKPSLLVLAPYLASIRAGAAQAAISMIRALHSRDNVSVHVASFEFEDGTLPDGVATIPLQPPAPRRFVWRVSRAFFVRDYEQALRSVALPAVDAAYTTSIEMGLAFRRISPSVPMIGHFGAVVASRESRENREIGEPWNSLDAAIADRLERKCYTEPEWSHLVSTELVARTRQEHFALPENPFKVRPLGVDVARFSDRSARAQVREQLGIDSDACAIISVSRMVPWKQLDWLVDVFPHLPAHCHLILVGDGEKRPQLESAIRAEDRARVHFVGHTDPVPYLAAADVFALPSTIESFGVAYVEAMCMGLPCVGLSYRAPQFLSSAQEVIEHGRTGFVISDERGLAGSLSQLASDETLRASMSRKSRERVERLYSATRYASSVEAEVFQQVDPRVRAD